MSENLKTKIEILIAAVVFVACLWGLAQIPNDTDHEVCERGGGYCYTVKAILD